VSNSDVSKIVEDSADKDVALRVMSLKIGHIVEAARQWSVFPRSCWGGGQLVIKCLLLLGDLDLSPFLAARHHFTGI
jgi:hypothetical protein